MGYKSVMLLRRLLRGEFMKRMRCVLNRLKDEMMRGLSCLVILLLMIELVPMNAGIPYTRSEAEVSADYFWYGNGTASSFSILTVNQMIGFSNIVNGLDGKTPNTFQGKTVSLGGDLDLTNVPWRPIGDNRTSAGTDPSNGPKFDGTFEGNNHMIKGINVLIPDGATENVTHYGGFFGVAGTNAIIRNVRLVSPVVNVTGGMGTEISSLGGGAYVGGLAGLVKGTVSNCHVIDGFVSAASNSGGSSDIASGGIAGRVTGTIQLSSFTGMVNTVGINTVSGVYADPYKVPPSMVGGIVGDNRGTIVNCSVVGEILNNIPLGMTFGKALAGGIAGLNNTNNISNSMFWGTVTGNTLTTPIGIGGIMGGTESNNTVSNCYYNNQIITGATNAQGTPLTGTEFLNANLLLGFDFEQIWHMGESYPILNGYIEPTAFASGNWIISVNTAQNRIDFYDSNIMEIIEPVKSIVGTSTRLSTPMDAFILNNELYVLNQASNTIDVFNINDSGDVSPKRSIRGGMDTPSDFCYDAISNEIYVANNVGSVTVYDAWSAGVVNPRTLNLVNAKAIAINGTVVYATRVGDTGIYGVDKQFSTLMIHITGIESNLSANLNGIAVDGANIYVSDTDHSAIKVFDKTYSAEGMLIGTLNGQDAMLVEPRNLTLDGNTLFVANSPASIFAFDVTQITENEPPVKLLETESLSNSGINGVAVGSFSPNAIAPTISVVSISDDAFLGHNIYGNYSPVPGTGGSESYAFYVWEREKGTSITVFNNYTVSEQTSGATPSSFELLEDTYISEIWTYHDNGGLGSTVPVRITLIDALGNSFGPFATIGTDSMNEWDDTELNTRWVAFPDQFLPAGIYTVCDSDPGTWSTNSALSGQGMINVLQKSYEGAYTPIPSSDNATHLITKNDLGSLLRLVVWTVDLAGNVSNPVVSNEIGAIGMADINNSISVVTSSWNVAVPLVYGEAYPFSIYVNDLDMTIGTKLYSFVDSNEAALYKTFTGIPDPTEITFTPVEGIIESGPHTLNYYAVDANGGSSALLTIPFTIEAPLSQESTLESLSITGVTLSPDFSSAVTQYTGTVPYLTDTVTVSATPTTGSNATVKINGVELTSKEISLAVGINSIAVVVTAEDGITTTAYQITLTREAAVPPIITDLEITGNSILGETLSASYVYTSPSNISESGAAYIWEADSGISATIFSNFNGDAVLNGGLPSSFILEQSTYISEIRTYHWNEGIGTADSRSIKLIDQNGIVYGPWSTIGSDGLHENNLSTANIYWIAYPNETLPMGTYTVMDSDPATWSSNPTSEGFGMFNVYTKAYLGIYEALMDQNGPSYMLTANELGSKLRVTVSVSDIESNASTPAVSTPVGPVTTAPSMNEAPRLTSDWIQDTATVTVGGSISFNISVTDFENMPGVMLYSVLDDGNPVMINTFQTTPGVSPVTIFADGTNIGVGEHIFTYFAVDHLGESSNAVSLYCTVIAADPPPVTPEEQEPEPDPTNEPQPDDPLNNLPSGEALSTDLANLVNQMTENATEGTPDNQQSTLVQVNQLFENVKTDEQAYTTLNSVGQMFEQLGNKMDEGTGSSVNTTAVAEQLTLNTEKKLALVENPDKQIVILTQFIDAAIKLETKVDKPIESMKVSITQMLQNTADNFGKVKVAQSVTGTVIVDTKNIQAAIEKQAEGLKQLNALQDKFFETGTNKNLKQSITIEVDIPKNSSEVKLALQPEMVDLLKNGKIESLSVKNVNVEIKLPVSDLKGSENTQLVIEKIPAPVVNQVLDAPPQAVYEFLLTVNDVKEEKFSKPITLTFNLNAFGFGNETSEQLSIFKLNLDTMRWEPVGGIIDSESGQIFVTRDNLSQYTVLKSKKSFKDADNSWAKSEINAMLNKGIVSESANFEPQSLLTRGEFATWIANAYGLKVSDKGLPFKDVPKDSEYYNAIAAVYQQGILVGDKNVFNPNKPLTQNELASALGKVLVSFDNKQRSDKVTSKHLSALKTTQVASWADEDMALLMELGFNATAKSGGDKITKEAAASAFMKFYRS